MSQRPQPTPTSATATEANGTDPRPSETRVFLFHHPLVARNPDAAMDEVNRWLAKDRAGTDAVHLRGRGVTITPDGAGGVYVTIVCSGVPARAALPRPAPSPPHPPSALPSRATTRRMRRSSPWSVNLFVALVAFLAVVTLIMTFLAWRT